MSKHIKLSEGKMICENCWAKRTLQKSNPQPLGELVEVFKAFLTLHRDCVKK